jgi:RNA polymerase sigma factor (sigma-70 family)
VLAELDLAGLARGAAAGDARALDELLAELRPSLVRAVRLVVGAGAWEAEDAAQEALLDVARAIGSLRDPNAVAAWALRIATTRALKAARRQRLLRLGRPLDQAPELSVETDARAADLKRAFDSLPPRLRAVAVLRLYVGLSEQEVSAVLDCAVGTVKSHLHEARRRLAAALGTGRETR